MSDIRKYINILNESSNKQPLKEAIEAHGEELVAYCIVVAEEYVKLPNLEMRALKAWEDLLEHNEKMLQKILKKVNIIYTKEDPYKNQREMMYDIIKNNTMRIFKTPSDDSHPGMTAAENDVFRALHDFVGHHLPNQKEFVKYLAKHNIKSTSDENFKKYRFNKNSFTVRGEMNTYFSHGKLLSDKVKPALFTEIVGQICTYFTTGDFTVNKVAFMDGVDYNKLGKFTDPKLTQRKEKYLELLKDDSVEKFDTELGTFSKSSIRWNLLSRGEGQTRK